MNLSLKTKYPEDKLVLFVFLSQIGYIFYLNIETFLGNMISLLFTTLFYYVVLRNLKASGTFIQNCLLFWIIVITINTFIFNTNDTYEGELTTLLIRFFVSPLFMPSLLLLVVYALPKSRPYNFRYFFLINKISLIGFFVLFPFAFYSMIHYDYSMTVYEGSGGYQDFITRSTLGISSLVPPMFFVYLKKYLPTKLWRLYLISILLSILLIIYLGRRGSSLVSVIYLLSAWFLYLFCNKKSNKFVMILLLLLCICAVFIMYMNTKDTLFAVITERGLDDTRSGVEKNFYKDLTSTDWLIGKGWFGTYYDSIFNARRSSIETGYLSLILRGGIIYLFLYIMVILFSAFKGIFKSNNILLKSFGLIMILSLIELKVYGWPMMNMNYYIIWLGVYMCNKKYYREMNDISIKEKLFKI